MLSEGEKCKLNHYFNREGKEGDRNMKAKRKGEGLKDEDTMEMILC
jgi:hypothetical protein